MMICLYTFHELNVENVEKIHAVSGVWTHVTPTHWLLFPYFQGIL